MAEDGSALVTAANAVMSNQVLFAEHAALQHPWSPACPPALRIIIIILMGDASHSAHVARPREAHNEVAVILMPLWAVTCSIPSQIAARVMQDQSC